VELELLGQIAVLPPGLQVPYHLQILPMFISQVAEAVVQRVEQREQVAQVAEATEQVE
jgi:hypothetical protein